ncbi:MAG: GatB/YqeY domain-containing protein [Bacteroidales bacterium]|jgi:uncharacterized protein YqeY|nr:GatB/YqeY domain-containing protein [Bacteroidales bacterium]
MALFEKITEDIKAAMLAKESVKLEALRGIKKEFLEAKTAKGNESGELSDEMGIKILSKMVKQRKESAGIFTAQNRADLAEREIAEAEFISAYLPKQMNEAELTTVIKEIIAQVGATNIQDLGKVMGVASKQLAGKADGKLISQIVRNLLQ